MAERTAELRSSSDTSALLRQALARADHIRSELGQLRVRAAAGWCRQLITEPPFATQCQA